MNTYERAISLVMSDPDLCNEISKLVARNVPAKAVRRPMSMTAAMRDLYQFIKDYTDANDGVAPSFEEMKEFAGLASKSGIHRLITALEERGLIRRLPHRARAIVCVEQELIRGEAA